ncbi:hypothetical protein L249_5026 [Ophiocordyceps polyrhachis-furcata BCC 54312]|uniref:Amidoligase enzyme n=1 Tax=Ophiocordyceps polyrhachis-furcata BCC 54312 TaxID=1330021 RepID=A0A367L3V3_9HYPO|nr:hypothetical protein L249_5026 [Ophiocordyceps polyrhachis-furcata BCC 54312]
MSNNTLAHFTLPDLQFGIELEFVSPPMAEPAMLNGKYPTFIHQNLRRQGCFFFLAQLLQNNGLPSAMDLLLTESDCGEDPYRADAPEGTIVGNDLRVMDPSTIPDEKAVVNKQMRFHYWMLKPECDLTHMPQYLMWSETELNSPILPESEATAGFPRVNKALELIATCHEAGVHINERCGLHVQISPVSGLTAQQAKQAVTVVFIIERCLLFHLCHPSRQQAHKPISRARFALLERGLTPGRNEVLDIELREWMPLAFLAVHGNRLRSLWDGSNDLEDISQLLHVRPSSPPKERDRCGLNLNGHYNSKDNWTYALEFRYAQASFNQDFVANWTMLLFAIAKVSGLPAAEFRDVISQLWDVTKVTPKPEDAWRPLLRIIGDAVPREEGIRLDGSYWERRLGDYQSKNYPDVVQGRAVLK